MSDGNVPADSLQTLVEEWRMAAKDERAEHSGGAAYRNAAAELENVINLEVEYE